MEKSDKIKFIDEGSPQHCEYVWKKKKAVQKTKIKEEKDFRQLCLESFKTDESSVEESLSESRTYFGKEGSSSGDDVPEIVEEEEELRSLSPRAPLVEDDEDFEYIEDSVGNLEIVVNESDRERIALTTSLTVKDEEAITLKYKEIEAETVIKYEDGNKNDGVEKTTEDVETRRKVHFKDDRSTDRKCDKKEDVTASAEELAIDLLFTEDVTVRVSFKDGKVIVEESDGGEGKSGSGSERNDGNDSIPELSRGTTDPGDGGRGNITSENELEMTRGSNDGGAFITLGDYPKVTEVPDKNTDSNTFVIKNKCSEKQINSVQGVNVSLEENAIDYTNDLKLTESKNQSSLESADPAVPDKIENRLTENEIVDEKCKLECEQRDSEKCSTAESDNLSVAVRYSVTDSDDKCVSSDLGSEEGSEDMNKNDTHDNTDQDKLISFNNSFKNNFFTSDRYLFRLDDIIEEESCSDIENEDDESSDSAVFVEAADNCDSVEERSVSPKTTISNDNSLQNYSKHAEVEDSSNSDSSLEKCEIEQSEKDMMKQRSNPILNLLEMQEREEIYESSLEILQEFRSNLIPGITSASNWISCCDSDELSLGVVGGEEGEREGEGEGSEECGRTALSTGGAGTDRTGGAAAAMISTWPPAVGQHAQHVPAWQDSGSDSDSDSDSDCPGGSLDTVINRPLLVDRETQCRRCECEAQEGSDKDEPSERPPSPTIQCDDNDNPVSTSDEGNDTPKTNLKDLFSVKRTTNALENLPLIFPRARGLSVTKPVNKFENLFGKSPSECVNSENSDDRNNNTGAECEAEAREESDRLERVESISDGSVKTDHLFQFNVVPQNHEGVTSFTEEVRSSSEDEMKQKKKQEDNRAQEEAMASNSELVNGYHRPPLKSALKRASTKKSKKKHRVQFDESLNKFFDADYVILIREETDDFEGDYDVGGCDCGEDFCYDDCCDEDEEESLQEPPSPRFDLCAAFEPPVEFVDQVTLSPPDGYKDYSHTHYCPQHHPNTNHNPSPRQATRRPDGREEWQQTEVQEAPPPAETRTEATNTDDDLNQGSTDQGLALSLTNQESQQQQRYIVETITMTTVTERRIVREADDQRVSEESGKLNGILKGGKLWKSSDSGNQTDLDDYPRKGEDVTQVTGDEDDRRGVRFNEGTAKNELKESSVDDPEKYPEGSDLNLTFKVGHTALATSKPNSAVRQLFPSQRFMSSSPVVARSPDIETPQEDKDPSKYLVTAENLKMFEEAKKSKLQQYYSSRGNSRDGCSQTISSPQQEHPPSDDDEGLSSSLIKRTIERNTLRRSLLKYPHDIRLKRNQNKLKNENSLVERIKQLTCDVDDDAENKGKEGESTVRTSPSGEESQRVQGSTPSRPDKIASSGMSSTYKKLTDLFSRRDKLEAAHPSVILQTPVSVERQYAYYQPVYHQQSTPPDLGNGMNTPPGLSSKHIVPRNSVTTEARKQFLSSLAPLTACVSGNLDDSPVNRENQPLPGDRNSIASTSTAQDSEYSLDDIEEVLNADENKSQPQPDVVAGTPAGNNDQDELALFVQQDAGRIERIRKRYGSTPNSAGSDDDEHDDYGFNRRPSVRGIKPRFGSTTEILQQMQSQLQPPPLACPSRTGSHITWPYYTPEDTRRGNPNRAAMPLLKEDTHFTYIPDPNLEYVANCPVDPSRHYQHQMIYSSAGNLHQPMRIGGGGDIQYPARVHHIHSDSPPRVPPIGMMVPFQDHDFSYRTTAPIYARRAIPGSVVQMRVSPIPAGSAVRLPLHPPYVDPEPHYSTQPLPAGTTSIIRVGQQQTIRVPYPTGGPVQVHLLATRRSESPQRGSPSQQSGFPANQYVVARGTQTSSISSTYFNIGNSSGPRGAYYPSPPLPQNNSPNYNRGPLIYSDHPPKPPHLFNNNNYPSNPHRATSPIQSLTSSPTRMKPQNERGVPEGAASSSPAFPQDSVYQSNMPSPSSEPPTTCDSATSPVTPPPPNPATPPSSVYYSMNV